MKLPEPVIAAARSRSDVIDSSSQTPAQDRARAVIRALGDNVTDEMVKKALEIWFADSEEFDGGEDAYITKFSDDMRAALSAALKIAGEE